MSLSAAILDALADAGATREQIIAAMKADIAERAATEAARIEAQKEGNRDRQRRKRERDNAKSRDVTDVTRDARDTLPNDKDILTPPVPPQVISDEITPPIENPKPISPEHVIEAWNVMAVEAGVPKAKMTPERRKKLAMFIRRHPIDDITEAIWAVPRTPFLRGENDRGWKASIDFMLQPSSFTKIIEGTYGEQSAS